MHVFASLMVLLVFAFAGSVVVAAFKASGGKAIAALAGRSVLAVSIEERTRVGQKLPDLNMRVRARTMPLIPANDGSGALPLAA